MNKESLPQIIIAEGEFTLCNTLAESLARRGFYIVGTAANGKKALDLLKSQLADLVLMDICMPILDGIATTEFISKNYPTVKVLMLSSYNKDVYIQHAVEAGAKGYILKDTHPDDIAKAINTIINGGNYFSPNVFNKLAKRTNNANQEAILKLSEKEKQILDLLTEGHTSDEISARSGMNVHSIRAYRKSLIAKFNAKNVAHLVALAFEKGYLDKFNLNG